MDESLAQGLYNRMSRDVHCRVTSRIDAISTKPRGRMRRNPWMKNRLAELKRIYREQLLFTETHGNKKHAVSCLFILQMHSHQRAQLCCVEVHALDYSVEYHPICLYINHHAMARVIQVAGKLDGDTLRQYYQQMLYTAINVLSHDSLILHSTVYIATSEGLSIWTIDEYDCGKGAGLTMRTFISKDVLNGNKIQCYQQLIALPTEQRYLITESRE